MTEFPVHEIADLPVSSLREHEGNPRRITLDRLEQLKRNLAEYPTMKPVELIERTLRNSALRGAIVYDPFGGSGSTMVAAETLGMRARLMELDPGYCDVIRARYTTYTGQAE